MDGTGNQDEGTVNGAGLNDRVGEAQNDAEVVMPSEVVEPAGAVDGVAAVDPVGETVESVPEVASETPAEPVGQNAVEEAVTTDNPDENLAPEENFGFSGESQPVVKPMNPKTKKTIIIVSAVVGGLAILGVLAVIFLPMLFAISYEETYTETKSLRDAVNSIGNYDSCAGVVSNAGSSYTSRADYDKSVEKCKTALENTKKYTDAVSGTAGLRDEDLKKKWDEYKTGYDRLMPAYEKMLKIYPSWHDFVANNAEIQEDSKWYTTVTEEKLLDAVKPLEDSGVEALQKYAEGYKKEFTNYVLAYKKYREAYDTWADTSYGSANYDKVRDAYYEAQEEADEAYTAWNEWDEDNEVDLDVEEMLEVDLDASENDLYDMVSDFYDVMYQKYLDEEFSK